MAGDKDTPKSKIEKKLEKEPKKNLDFGSEKVFVTGIIHDKKGVVKFIQLGKSGNIFPVSEVKEFMSDYGLNLWINNEGSPTELELAGDSIRSKKNGTLVDNLDNAPVIKF